MITVFPEIRQIFLAWFTYDTERPPEDVAAFLGEPGHWWMTAQGQYEENVAELILYVTTGGVFDSEEPTTSTEPYGKIMLEFSTCNAGTVTYDIPFVDRQGVVPIERISLDNVSLCDLFEQIAFLPAIPHHRLVCFGVMDPSFTGHDATLLISLRDSSVLR